MAQYKSTSISISISMYICSTRRLRGAGGEMGSGCRSRKNRTLAYEMEIKTIATSAISLTNRLQKDDFYNFCKYDTFISTSGGLPEPQIKKL